MRLTEAKAHIPIPSSKQEEPPSGTVAVAQADCVNNPTQPITTIIFASLFFIVLVHSALRF
jgi:hypothetical protein